MDLCKRNTLLLSFTLTLSTLVVGHSYANNSDDPVTHIGPPSVSVVDRMGVDLTSGISSHSVTDVMIGGNRGLTHVISSAGGKFNVDTPLYRGFQDGFFGTISGGVMTNDTTTFADDTNILTVSDGGETVRFVVSGSSGNYTFRDIRSPSLSGARNQLTQLSSSQAIWTKADGTKVIYTTFGWLGPGVGTKARMKAIEYPNGFTIHADYSSQYKLASVSTNTGYQLKYIFENDMRSVSSSQQNYIYTTTFGDEHSYSSAIWSASNPKYVVALNNDEQTCSLTATTCSYASHWPKATYVWPAGMPRVSYLPEPVDFIVKDAENRQTKFTMRGFDIATPLAAFSSGYWADIMPGERAVSRITHVTPPSGKTIEYTYENKPELVSGFLSINGYVRHSVLTEAKRGNDELLYFFALNNGQGNLVNYRSQGHQSMEALYFNQASESLSHFRNWDMDVGYTMGFANSIAYVDTEDAPKQEYDYDSRGNVTKVTQTYSTYDTVGIVSQATYANACTVSNQKYCNKTSTTTDPNGNVTNYTYHAPSGSAKTVTLPANKHGVRAKTTYNYQQYTANHNGYYSSPIWLMSEVITCATAMTCSTAQEIKTIYEYEPSNLQLVGEVVTADGETFRTCYAYDKYGNQVTVMPPKDNLTKSTCIN